MKGKQTGGEHPLWMNYRLLYLLNNHAPKWDSTLFEVVRSQIQKSVDTYLNDGKQKRLT